MSFFVIKFTIGKQNLMNELIASQQKKNARIVKDTHNIQNVCIIEIAIEKFSCNFGSCTTRRKNIYQIYETVSKFLIT